LQIHACGAAAAPERIRENLAVGRQIVHDEHARRSSALLFLPQSPPLEIAIP
jgi:hypothetical protein